MVISSRTPEGEPHQCPICGEVALLERCDPIGDTVCPACGSLVRMVERHRGDLLEQLRNITDLDSMETVELVMELEEEFDIAIPDDEAKQIQSLQDAIRWLRKNRPELGS